MYVLELLIPCDVVTTNTYNSTVTDLQLEDNIIEINSQNDVTNYTYSPTLTEQLEDIEGTEKTDSQNNSDDENTETNKKNHHGI